jgi:hypothetical protein
MRRALLLCGGTLLGLAAWAVLSNAPELYLFTDSWHSAALTRVVGLGVIAEGALAAFWAALCLGRAVAPLSPGPTRGGTAAPGPAPAAAGGGPVLPLCGTLFLLAAAGPFGQARREQEALEVMDSMPGRWGGELVEDHRLHERAGRAFGVLWLAAGGWLLATPLFLKRRVWQLGWRMSGVGCGIAAGGVLLSGMGAFVCYANGLAMEGASKELALAGYIGLLAGAVIAVCGSVIAAA